MTTMVPAILTLPLTVLAVALLAEAVNFDNLPVGTAPPGWTATRTGTGNAKWTVEKACIYSWCCSPLSQP